MQAVFDAFLAETAAARSRKELDAAYEKARAGLDAAALCKPEHPLRVGIIGEYYTVMDDFGNHNVERILAYMGQGVEIHRWMTFTHRNLEYDEKADLAFIAPYVRYSMGPTSSAPWPLPCATPRRASTASSTSSPSAARRRWTSCPCCRTSAPIKDPHSLPQLRFPDRRRRHPDAAGGILRHDRNEKEERPMKNAYLGIDIGSISTKGVIIDDNNNFLASEYIWTEGNPIEAVRRLLELLEAKFDKDRYQVVSVGTTGSARRLIGRVVGAS